MLLTAAQKRINLGNLLADDKLEAWIVPFAESGNIYANRITQLTLQKQWYTPKGKRAIGNIQFVNHSSTVIFIPTGARWEDGYGGGYRITRGGIVEPNALSVFKAEALIVGDKDYYGLAKCSTWLNGENADIDLAEIKVLYAQTELPYGESEDEKDDLSCSVLETTINVKRGAYPGENALVLRQKNPLYWIFYPGETLAGFKVMSERMSGYVYHRINIKPTLLFWEQKYIQLRPDTVQIRFTGIKREKDS